MMHNEKKYNEMMHNEVVHNEMKHNEIKHNYGVEQKTASDYGRGKVCF